jgi:hypothetical protein
MKSKLLLATSALLTLASLAHAAYDLDNGVKIIPNGIAGVQFNDNVFLSQSNETSDTIWVLSPGVSVVAGEGALNTTTFSFNEQFQFFSDDSNLNSNLAIADFSSRFDDGKMKIAIDAWLHQANQATRDIRNATDLVDRDLLHGAISDEVQWTDKSSVKVGATYNSTNYKPAGYRDWTYFEVPVQYYYKYLPKLDLSAGIKYRKNTIGGAGSVDSDEAFYNVGARGEITPKLTGEIQVGYIQFNPDSGKSKSSIGLLSQFAFALTQKSAITFGASNQYGYGAQGDSYRTTSVFGGANVALSNDFQVSGQIAYNKFDYSTSTRKDDFWSGLVSATYSINRELSVNGTWAYANNDSSLTGADFKNNVLAVSGTYKF